MTTKTTPPEYVPRFHLFIRYAGQSEEGFGWDDHAGSHQKLQKIFEHIKKLPEDCEWQIVDLVTYQVLARSSEMGQAKH